MQKSMQNKLIIICIILGTCFIGLFGYFYIRQISSLTDIQQVIELSKKYIISAFIVFVSVVIIGSEVLKRVIKKSMISIVKNAGKLVTGN